MSDQIFISYAHKDERFIQRISENLNRHFVVWVDKRLEAGNNWKEDIDDAIRRSFAVLMVVTPDSCASHYVTYEWSFALGLGVPVIPVVLKHPSSESIHPRIRDLQWLDFSDGYFAPWDQLIERLQAIRLKSLTPAATLAALELLRQARQQVQQNEPQNALDSLNEALIFANAKLKDDIEFEIASIYFKLKKYDMVESHLQSSVKYNPQHARSFAMLGTLYRTLADEEEDTLKREKQLLQSAEHFLAALQTQDDILDDSGESIWGSLGGIYKRIGDVTKAIEAYNNALHIKPGSYPYNNLGMLYMEKREIQTMLDSFSLVELYSRSKISSNPGDEWAQSDLLIAQLVLGKISEAENTFAIVRIIARQYTLETLLRTLHQLSEIPQLSEVTRSFLPGAIQVLEARLRRYVA